MKNLFVFLFFPLLMNCQAKEKLGKLYTPVGEIKFDENLDDKNFKLCDKPVEYYNLGKGFIYNGEKFRIIELFEKTVSKDFKENKSGYITVRFLVNCDGRSGYFRVQQFDEDCQLMKFDPEFIKAILDFTKNLDGWEKGKDFYQYLTYKIERGKVTEILP